jgi:hypothetical protein
MCKKGNAVCLAVSFLLFGWKAWENDENVRGDCVISGFQIIVNEEYSVLGKTSCLLDICYQRFDDVLAAVYRVT